ncbi:haloacid dehalogenase type II [Nocardioides plantarum]|uniref:Haloacid dehalogenase type II n=1 Tax=Nocardioides plantarum TaxID=29299 RepID=A0ABV5K593_9ACTN|nr:haloacid dehalogenase type II [Nocardioides plantarum]
MELIPLDPDQVDAVVFDVIGTLVDEDATWASVADRLAVGAGVDPTADLLTSWVDTLERHMSAVVAGDAPWRPHRQLVGDSAREAVASTGGDPTSAALDLVADLDSDYPAWPDVAPGTAALRRSRLVVGVSNGDLDALARLAHRNAISWDLALSTGAVATFKPDPAAYRYAIDALRLDPARTLFAAAHPWDLRAAAEHGFRTAYVARPGAERPSQDDRFDVVVDDVSALADLLGRRAERR